MDKYNIALTKLSQFLPFLHIIGVIFLVSFQISLWCILRYARQSKDLFKIIQYFGIICIFSMVTIIISGFLMDSLDEIRYEDPMARAILTTKITIFGFIGLNIGYMAYHFLKAKQNRDSEVFENLLVIFNYFLSLNLALCMLAIYLGVAYRSF